MTSYILRRIGEMLTALVLMSMIIFALGRLTGDPVALLLGDYATEQDRIELVRQLGLDRPLPQQYVVFAAAALRGDLGRSVSGDQRLPSASRPYARHSPSTACGCVPGWAVPAA